jgi:superoxide dismutase, Cu-Zn family
MKVTLAFVITSFFMAQIVFAEATSLKMGDKVTADILNNQGNKIGAVQVTKASLGVLINIKATQLSPGYHGMHFHAVGDCSDHGEFKKAGAHVDPMHKPHGFLNEKGPHEGNLPNLIVDKNGDVEVELYSNLVGLTNEIEANLLDADGSALIIHANRDDHTSQPIGNSGARVGCAVIR